MMQLNKYKFSKSLRLDELRAGVNVNRQRQS